MGKGGIYECVNCGHREVLDSNEPSSRRAVLYAGGATWSSSAFRPRRRGGPPSR